LSRRSLAQQAAEGENKAERPMWAEKGGLDFEGRARWDAWTARKGMAADKAKLEFVKVRARSLHPGHACCLCLRMVCDAAAGDMALLLSRLRRRTGAGITRGKHNMRARQVIETTLKMTQNLFECRM